MQHYKSTMLCRVLPQGLRHGAQKQGHLWDCLSPVVIVIQSLSCVWLFATARTAGHQLSLSFGISQSLLNSYAVSWWCQPTISFSVALFSSYPQSFPASGPVNWLFTSGGQSIGASASESVLPMNIQSWLPLGLTGLISLLKRDSQESSLAPEFESINSSALGLLYSLTLTSICDCWKNRFVTIAKSSAPTLCYHHQQT